MKAFNSLVEMCGPVFENLDAKGRKKRKNVCQVV